MTNPQTPKGLLEEQLTRLRLDDDLRHMVSEGLRKMTDEEALKMAVHLKAALDAIPDAIKELMKPRPEYVAPPNPNFPDLDQD